MPGNNRHWCDDLIVQRVIQINTLEDRSVHDKTQWDAAIKFMETTVSEKLKQSTYASLMQLASLNMDS